MRQFLACNTYHTIYDYNLAFVPERGENEGLRFDITALMAMGVSCSSVTTDPATYF
jgi:hypothetical protein